MTQTMQDEFEADYCAHAHRLPALVKNCRLSNGSYGDPCIAKAWHWFKRSREMLVVESPDDFTSDGNPKARILIAHHREIVALWVQSIEAVGVKVKP